MTFRRATPDDIPALERLIAASARGLAVGDYTATQVEGALGGAWGVDRQLIDDGTYFVVEGDGGALVACGGWSLRKTRFGSDGAGAVRDPALLDPAVDAARVRAFFVHPDVARQGVGRALLWRCEDAARAAGFAATELVATLPGRRLYLACGYTEGEPFEHPLPNGGAMVFVPMRKALGAGVAQTERLILRRFRADDAAAMEAVFGDPEVMRYSDHGVQDAAWVAAWLSAWEAKYLAWGFGLWAVVLREAGAVIGYCGLTRNGEDAELGYRLARAHWGKGLATEAARTVCALGREILRIPKIVAQVDPENGASVRVAQKCGMRHEGDILLPGYDHPDRRYILGG